MKLSVINSAVLCTLAGIGITACNGGSSDTSSSTTSGSTVVGTIAGFGSIIMDNGVEYETDGLSDCDVDDQAIAGKCEDSLSTGMHVTLHTDANGGVTSVKYDDELEGVITGPVTGANGDYTFKVYNVTITTTNPGTQWDDFNGNPPATGDDVEISGEWQQDGSLIASYIEKQSDASHEVKGTVGTITGTDFPLTIRNGSTIDVDGSALSQLPAEGAFVEVKGSYDNVNQIFVADAVEIEDEDDFDSDSEFEIKGTLTANANSSTGLSIGNIDVDISNASSCNGLTGSLVEAEGRFNLDTGVLMVRECENEDDGEDMEVKCLVSGNALIPDLTKPKVGSVECDFPGTTGGPLTFTFKDTPELAMFSGDSTASRFDLTNVLAGDCVEVKFSKDANGAYIAGLIEHEGTGCDSYELEGTVDSFIDGTDITALGVTFAVNSPVPVYEPTGSNTSLTAGDMVKIEDSDADGNADKIEVK